jgi:glycosyltransferase involved in cell wall biosynthesis
MKVKVIYRNYKSLHDLYASFRIEPPKDVTYSIPRPKRYLRYLLPLHRRLGNLVLVRFATSEVQKLFFRDKTDNCDLYHFVQMIPESIPRIPYVVDFEHVSALVGFSKITPFFTRQIERFLDSPGCCRIIPLTFAARKSLTYLLGDDYERIANKVDVVYPALPNYYALLKDEADYSYVDPAPDKLRLLFVGSGVYRKGLPELLRAFQELEGKYGGLRLYVISDAPRELTQGYASDRIKYFLPRFSHQEIVRKFYLPADVFILPTHSDSFGMASLYALSCGTPVVTTDQFANPEIIEPGRNGAFVHSERLYLEQVPLPAREKKDEFYGRGAEQILIDSLVENIEQLYLDRDVLARMSQQAVKDFEPGGKFSIDVRNRKLGEIYRSCLC